jgi:hypothetical protein
MCERRCTLNGSGMNYPKYETEWVEIPVNGTWKDMEEWAKKQTAVSAELKRQRAAEAVNTRRRIHEAARKNGGAAGG